MTLGIQFGGLASGLDTGAIIDAILAVEGRSLRGLESRKQAEQSKLSLIGTFEGLVNTLRDKARDLQKSDSFLAHKLSLGQEGIASVSLSGSAQAGSHRLEVFSLASSDRYAFAGVADPDTTGLGAGTIGFTYDGTTYSVDVASGSDTLNGIAAAINSAAGEDVTASVVNAGTASSPSYQLVIAGKETGADFAITGLSSSVAGLGGATRVSDAANALVKIDGLDVQRSSNVFADVLPGVSFTVSRLTADTGALSFTVDVDPEGIRTNIQEFVDAYNGVIDFINKQSTFSLEEGPGGPLFGDNVLSTIRTNLRRSLFNPDSTVLASNPDFGSLGILGISLESDGKLAIDQSTLDDKLSSDLEAFEDFFNRADDLATVDVDERGIFVRLQETLDGVLESSSSLDGTVTIEGLFQARRSAIARLVKGFDDESERLQFRLEKLEESLIRKFASLEQLLGGLQSQQSFLNANTNLGTGR